MDTASLPDLIDTSYTVASRTTRITDLVACGRAVVLSFCGVFGDCATENPTLIVNTTLPQANKLRKSRHRAARVVD